MHSQHLHRHGHEFIEGLHFLDVLWGSLAWRLERLRYLIEHLFVGLRLKVIIHVCFLNLQLRRRLIIRAVVIDIDRQSHHLCLHHRCRFAQRATRGRYSNVTAFKLGDGLSQSLVLFLHLLQLFLNLFHLVRLLGGQSFLLLVLDLDLQVLLEGPLQLLLYLILLLL